MKVLTVDSTSVSEEFETVHNWNLRKAKKTQNVIASANNHDELNMGLGVELRKFGSQHCSAIICVIHLTRLLTVFNLLQMT